MESLAADLHEEPRPIPDRPTLQGWLLRAAVNPWLEGALIAVAPLAVFLGLRVRAMAAATMVDGAFYQAYAENGPELIQRFGSANYFWSRVGFTVPARVFWRAFGVLPGFYAFRYVLALVAIVPAYLLLKRLRGSAAGWIAVLVVLTCPVFLTAWGSDYPDSAEVSYLLAGMACLVMPAPEQRRWPWLLASGALFALAVYAQPIAALVAVGTIAVYLVVFRRFSVAAGAVDLLLLAIAALAVTGILVLASRRIFGVGDFFTPTLQAATNLRQPASIAAFHSTTWRWLMYDVYLLVPPTAIAAWLMLAWRARPSIQPQETVLVLATLVAVLVFTALQFGASSWTLEAYFYSSALFPGTCLVTTAVIARLARPLLRMPVLRLLPIGLVVAVPALLRPLREIVQFELPVAIVIALVAVGLAFTSRFGAVHSIRRLGTIAALLVCSTALLTGLPLNRPLLRGQSPNITPDYGSVLFTDGSTSVDEYVVASELRTVVPSIWHQPGDMMMWWPRHHDDVVNFAAAQYLWTLNSLPETMPALDGAQAHELAARAPRWLVLLSDDDSEFDAAMQQLHAQGFGAQTWREQTLASGSVRMHVRVLELTAFPR